MRPTSGWSLGKLLCFLGGPLLFSMISPRWLEERPSICLSRLVFGSLCPGCGMVRALSCLVHGEVRNAWHYNRLVFLVAPLLSVIWGQSIYRVSQEVMRVSRNEAKQ